MCEIFLELLTTLFHLLPVRKVLCGADVALNLLLCVCFLKSKFVEVFKNDSPSKHFSLLILILCELSLICPDWKNERRNSSFLESIILLLLNMNPPHNKITKGEKMVSSADANEIKQRAQLIRQRAMFSSTVRMMFIPAITAYSFFMTRPREGHFHRYIAERRFYDVRFNAQFPRLRHPQAEANNKNNNTANKTKDAKKNEDSDRALRRSAMFRREANLLESDEVADRISNLDLNELREEKLLAEHRATIPEIMTQLRELSTTSTTASQEKSDSSAPLHNVNNNNNNIAAKHTNTSDSQPTARLSFSESYFWSRGELHVPGQEVPRRFIGIFGMLWWEL